ncbi:MAG: hypothetical protein BHV77_04030 [Bacteroides sp. 43_108]|nr:MAG: hypothetical protein BHV77_04030 [Bacteroides sp. 43_108]
MMIPWLIYDTPQMPVRALRCVAFMKVMFLWWILCVFAGIVLFFDMRSLVFVGDDALRAMCCFSGFMLSET